MQNTSYPNLLSRIIREKLIVAQLIKNFPAFHGTPKFFNMFTRASIGSYPQSV